MASLTLTLPGVALVTGAAGGIGAAIVKAFVRAGCSRLAITDANSDALEQVHRDILDSAPVSKVVSLSGDLSDEGFVASLADAVHTAFGRVDYVVNVAGVLGGSLRSTETSVEEFDRINRVNYRGTWLSSRAMLSLMLKQEPLPEHGEMRGSVVNIASQLGIVARPGAGELIPDCTAQLRHSTETVTC